jgi:hypothetical protein
VQECAVVHRYRVSTGEQGYKNGTGVVQWYLGTEEEQWQYSISGVVQ